jgi:putative heme-binding domain-containing protein
MHTGVPFWFGSLIVSSLVSVQASDELGLKVAPGFRVSLYSDQDLADDIYAMTLDSQGRVVVTSQGFVTRLEDTKGLGRADRARLLVKTASGGMGLCFDGNDLMFCGDGWLSRYRYNAAEDRLETPPQRLVPLRFAEHGGHAMRRGADGWWYVIAGNDAEVSRRNAATADSPVRQPEAGAVLRLSPDLKKCEVFAHGFRNPYDFDFNAAGDLFTYDSDCERDAFLPWYMPTRLFHVARGGHHGWRLTGYQRSWPRPDYSPDTVDILHRIGRGSPTGVVCYRHDQFPAHYRGGLFFLDWTFGRVYFAQLNPDGTTYRSEPEVFIEPLGTHGFAPTDAVVAPDGSLLISIGGRRTRGAVYKVEAVGPRQVSKPGSEVDQVLEAPQPIDAWSRARWEPIALKLGPAPFVAALRDEAKPTAERIRAVEVLTEKFEGLPAASAEAGLHSSAPEVRARVAWSLGRAPGPGAFAFLTKASIDVDPRVRLRALEAIDDRASEWNLSDALGAISENLGQSEKRVRQQAARLATRLDDKAWDKVWKERQYASSQAKLSTLLAALWRGTNREPVIEEAVALLSQVRHPDLRLQALRLIVLALGDYRLYDPPVEVFTAYSVAGSAPTPEALVSQIQSAVRRSFPSGNERCDEEAARLLAMLEDNDLELPRKVATFWTGASSATRDLHFLIVLARLRGPRDSTLNAQTARTLVSLDGKLAGQGQRIKQTWNERLAELVAALVQRDPGLSQALVDQPEFVRPAHVGWPASLDASVRPRAARLFLEAVKRDADFDWSEPLVALLATLPPSELLPVLRTKAADFALRDAVLPLLASNPEAGDRDAFLGGLESAQPRIVRVCLKALGQLPRDPEPAHVVPILRLLRRLLSEPKEKTLRTEVLDLLARQTGRASEVMEGPTDLSSLQTTYQPVFDGFTRAHPTLARVVAGDDEDVDAWRAEVGPIDWSRGDSARGEAIFRARSCRTCHAGPGRLGPDLSGVTGRFSRDDLLAAIVAPNRDVAPAYRVTLVETKDGQTISGIVVFESADGLIVQTGASTTLRIASPDISARRLGQQSLMPSGLLKGIKADEVADLYRYLQTLNSSGKEMR